MQACFSPVCPGSTLSPWRQRGHLCSGRLGRDCGCYVFHNTVCCCCCCSPAKLCSTPCNPENCSAPGSSVLHDLLSFLKLMSMESMMPSNHPILCCPVLLLPSIFPSIMVFSNESDLCSRWPKYWSFSFSISDSNEYSGLISFRIDWLDLLLVQGTLKGLLQHHSLKASVLQHSAFFMVQLSHLHMTTGKTLPLTTWTFVVKVISLLFNMLSKFVIAFLARNKHLLISWLQSLSTLILEPKKIKYTTVSTFSPSIYHEVMRLFAMILVI